MEAGLVTQIVLPLALFFIMLGVGMNLQLAELTFLKQRPFIVIQAVLLQLMGLPLLGVLVVSLFQLPVELAVGILILTLAPGGASSNMITFLARGDTALSVCLTSISGLITPFTMPLLTVLILERWLGESMVLDFPIVETMLKLIAVAVLPAIIGVLLQQRWPQFCQRSERWVKAIACVFLVLVVFGIVKANWEKLPGLTLTLGPAVLTLVMCAMLLGYFTAKRAGLNDRQQTTLAIEVGIQNAATALIVTGGILHNAEMSASALIYGVLMNIPVFALIIWRNLPAKSLLGQS